MCLSAICGCFTNNFETQWHKTRMTSYFSCFWGRSGQSCSPHHSQEPLRRWQSAGAGLGCKVTKQASHTHVGFGSHLGWDQTPLLTASPSRWYFLSKASPHGLFPAGGPKHPVDNSKKQSQNLVNFLRDRPGAVTDHAVTASLRASPGSRLERTLQLFIGGWPARTVRGLGEDCGTYFEGPQCVCVQREVGQMGNQEVLYEISK